MWNVPVQSQKDECVWCSKNDVRVRLVFDNMLLDLLLGEPKVKIEQKGE